MAAKKVMTNPPQSQFSCNYFVVQIFDVCKIL